MEQPQANPSSKRAVVLLSGGLDSATTLAIARDAGYRCIALTFRYGQRHEIEVEAAAKVALALKVEQHITMPIDLRAFGGSALTDAIEVPKDRSEIDMAAGIPITYVPARNLIFLSHAVACAEVNDAHDIFIGVNAIDYSGYPDCRANFIKSFEQTANLGTKAGTEGDVIHLRTPLIDMTKSQIIQRGIELGVDYSMTISCYDPNDDGRACGRCDSCLLRARGFDESGVADPACSAHTPQSSPSA